MGQLQTATVDDYDQILLDYVVETVTRILGLDTSQLSLNQPLDEMGLDSLMSAELKNRLSSGLKIDIPLALFVGGVTVTSLSTEIKQRLGDIHLTESMADPSIKMSPDSSHLLDNLDQLSDQEVEQLLNSMIS